MKLDHLTDPPNASFDRERDILDTQERNQDLQREWTNFDGASLVSLLCEIPTPPMNFLISKQSYHHTLLILIYFVKVYRCVCDF